MGSGPSVWSVYTWCTELIVFAIVPIVILILNVLVIREVREISKSEEKRLFKQSTKSSKGSKTSATTVTLLAVSFYLIVTTLPVTIFYSMGHSFEKGDLTLSEEEIKKDKTWQRYLTFWAIRIFVQQWGMSHYACNFFIYLLTGKKFRDELKKLLCQRSPWKNDDYNRSVMFSALPQTELKNGTSGDRGLTSAV